MLTAIVTRSLDRNAYFYYRLEHRLQWKHPTSMVAFVALATVVETIAAYTVFAGTSSAQIRRRSLLAFVGFGSWAILISMYVMHMPEFWALHILWVWLLVVVMGLTTVGLGWLVPASRPEDPGPQRAVEQRDEADEAGEA